MTDHDADWMNDPAHAALAHWISSWRTMHTRSTRLPGMIFTDHIGRAATAMWKVDHVPKVEMIRLWSAAGYDGRCLCCGRTPDEVESDTRKARRETQPAHTG